MLHSLLNQDTHAIFSVLLFYFSGFSTFDSCVNCQLKSVLCFRLDIFSQIIHYNVSVLTTLHRPESVLMYFKAPKIYKFFKI